MIILLSEIETQLEKYQRFLKESNKNMETAKKTFEESKILYGELVKDHEKIKNLIRQYKNMVLDK